MKPSTQHPRLLGALAARLVGRHSILARLLLWTVGLTGLILVVVIGWNYLAVLSRLESDAQHRAAFIAEASADKIDSDLGILQGLVQGVALTLETQALAVPFEQIRALQERVLRDYPQLFGLAIALLPDRVPRDWPAGAPYVYRGPLGLVAQDLATQASTYLSEDWFNLPRYLDQGAWSEPYLWSTGVKMVAYSVPLHVPTPSGQHFAGVVRAEIEVGWLDRMIAGLPVGRHGYGLLMTGNGTYVSHPIGAVVFNETIFSIAEARGDASLRALGQRMTSGKPGLVPWVSWAAGEPSWLAWHPLDTVGWTMGTVISKAELHAEIRRFSQQEALVGFFGLGLLVLAVWLVARSITQPVGALGMAAATLAAGDLEAVLPRPRGRDEVAQLTAAFATMRDSLRRYIADLATTTAARERLNGELRIAHEIQMDLVPKTFPPFPERDDMDLFALMVPAREVGGDFYDFLALDRDRLVIAIGDVSGKGVPAALFMAVTRSFLRSAFRIDSDPGRALTRVNDDLAESNESCMFVTLFCAVVNLADGVVEYANAGHNPPLLVEPDGRHRWIDSPSGPAAGALPGSCYVTGHCQLDPGASLLLYTDGVTEAMDPAQRLYGTERLAEQLGAECARDCRGTLESLLADLNTYAAGTEQADDITMLLFKRRAPSTGDAPAPDLQLEIANRVDDLEEALARFDGFLESTASGPRLAYAVRLVVEELVTNIIKYGYDDEAEHRIGVSLWLAPVVTLCIEDDGHPFDPTAHPPAIDLDAPIEDRLIGGLGLHMVREVSDSLRYRRVGDRNRLEVVLRTASSA